MKNVIINSKMCRTLILTSSLLLGTFNTQANVILSFVGDDISVGLNDTFEIALFAETETPSDSFIRFGLDIDFNSDILNYDGFALDSNFSGPLADAFYFDPTFTSPSIGGSNILLGTFSFTAIDYGDTSLKTISESFTSLLSFITISSESASANISVVSAPATLSLFAAAFLGLVGLRRKA